MSMKKNCVYTLTVGDNIKKFESELDLNNYIKANLSKLSLVDIDAIYSLKDKAIPVVSKLESLKPEGQGYSVNDLLESKQLINGKEKLLLPQYILSERRKNTKNEPKVREMLQKEAGKRLSEKEYDDIFNTYFDGLLKKEDQTLQLSNYLHNLINISIKYGVQTQIFRNEIERLSSSELVEIIGEGNSDAAKVKITGIVKEIHKQITALYSNNGGKVYPEFKIIAKDYLGKNIVGKIDILAVTPDGKIHIIDVKLSKDAQFDWDDAKRSHVNYQLMVYRQMLAQLGFTGESINLYTIPLKFEVGNINSLTTPSPETIQIVNLKTLNTTQESFIDYNKEKSGYLKQIIPARISESNVDVNEVSDRIDKILLEMFPKYSFRTKQNSLDVEDIFKVALKRKDENGYRFYNEDTGKDETGFKTEEALRKRIEEYMGELNNNKNIKIVDATEALIEAKKTGKKTVNLFPLRHGDNAVKAAYNIQFEKYLDEDWSVIESDVLINAGMIGFEHTNGQVEFIIFTVNNLSKLQVLPKGDTILSKYYSSAEIAHNFKNKHILASTNANIELIKAMTTINQLPEFFANGRKLGNIKAMNYMSGLIEEVNIPNLLDNFAILTNEVKVDNNFNKSIPVANYIDIIEDTVTEIFTKTEDPKLKNIFINDDNDEVKMSKVERLEKLRERMIDIYPHLAQNINKFTFNSQEEKIFLLIAEGITYYKNLTFYNDYAVSKLGLTFSELFDFIKSPFTYNITSIDKKGNKKVGLLGGTLLSSTDSLPSKDMLNIYQLFNFAMQEQRDLFEPSMTKIVNKTKQWQEKLGYGELYNTVISGTYDINKNLYKTNDKGELDADMLFKNPFVDTMSQIDSDYLKFMLWQINKWKIKGLAADQRKLDYKEAYKLDKVKEAMEESTFFEVPLGKGLAYTNLKGLTSENIADLTKNKIADMKDWFDKREITAEQEIDLNKQSRNYNFMSNRFRMSKQARQSMLKNHPTNYWEINLDKIVLDFEKEYIQENAINKVLPTIQSALLTLKFNAEQSGKNIDNALEYFFDQVKSSIFNESLISEEMQDPLKVVEIAKKALSYSALALRPSLLIKETIVGTFANVVRAATGVYGVNSFKLEHLTQAYKIMMGLDSKFSTKFNIANAIDHVYAISNMDINQLVDRTRADRAGVTAGTRKHLFFFSTQADYWNRMTLFIAQMIKDGNWDSHSIDENGALVYDWTKDKRFDEYAKFKDKEGYTSENFLKQKSLYLTYIKQLRAEGALNKNGKLINFGDDLIKAYTSKDRESLKSFADMAYGYYDHEKKSLINNMAFGSIFMQFMTYWTAKWKTWTIRPGTETMQGRWVEKTRLQDGKQMPLYEKLILDSEGNIIDVEETTETDGTLTKVMEWEGTHMEGLFWSITGAARDLFHGKISDTINDPLRVARLKLAFHDILMAYLGIALAKLFFQLLTEEMDIDYTDDDYSLLESMTRDTEFAVVKAMGEFNPFTNTLGGLSVKPGFVDFWQKVPNDLAKMLSGDKSVEDVSRRYIKALSLVPEFGE